MNIWGILGIPPSSDADTIRRAYASQVKKCHPEDHPKEFQQLNKAYRIALAVSAAQAAVVSSAAEFTAPPLLEPQGEKFDYADLPQSIMKDDDIDEQDTHNILNEMRAMLAPKALRLSVWKSFFSGGRFARAMDNPSFIGEFTDLLRQKMFSFSRALCKEILRIYFAEGHRDANRPPYRQLSQIIKVRLAAKKRRSAFKSFVISYRNLIVPILPILIFFLILVCGSLSANRYESPKHENKIINTSHLSDISDPTDYQAVSPSDSLEENWDYRIREYLSEKYANLLVNFDSFKVISGTDRLYQCSLIGYDDLSFNVFIKNAVSQPVFSNDLVETAIEKLVSDSCYAYHSTPGTVYFQYKNEEDLDSLAELIVDLPSSCSKAYPFTRMSKVRLCILPQGTPYPSAKITAYTLLSDNDWLKDKDKALNTLNDMYREYIVKYEPWENPDVYHESLNQYLNYGEPVTVLINKKPQTFQDVRAENGYMASGDIYRLCQHLNITFREEGRILTVSDNDKRISCDEAGAADMYTVAYALGITLH